MHAIQLAVRGFHDQQTGNKLIDVLDELGFEIKDHFDGFHDSMGGIIETQITDTTNLENDDLDEIRKAIYGASASIQVYIEYRQFEMVKNWFDEVEEQK